MNRRIKGEDGVHVRGKEVKGVWESHFQCIMNNNAKRGGIVLSMNVEAGGVYVQKGIDRKKVKVKKTIDLSLVKVHVWMKY